MRDKYFYANIFRWKQNQCKINIFRKYFQMKTKSRNKKLTVSLINYQVLIAKNIILYLAKEQGKSFYLKERYRLVSNSKGY